jgi:hypothetical protein
MSLYSGRALYLPTGQASYSINNNRALFADAGPIALSASPWFYGGAYSSTWNATTYAQAQADALAALQADTTLSNGTGWGAGSAHAIAGAKSWYGTRAYAQNSAMRYTFALPTGKRGSLTKLSVLAYTGAARFYNLYDYYPSVMFDNSSWDDFGASIKLFFSESSTAYADGDDLYAGTADLEYAFEDINDYHINNSKVPGYVSGQTYRDFNVYPRLILTFDSDALDKVNAFTSDTIYLWAVVKKYSDFPYYLDENPSNYDSDFEFNAKLYNPALLVSDQ